MIKEEEIIIEQIRRLENESQSLEIDKDEREVLLKKVNDYTESFLNTLPQQKAYEKKAMKKTKETMTFK